MITSLFQSGNLTNLDNIMSIFPFFVSLFSGVFLFSFFTWNTFLLFFTIVCVISFVVLYLYEVGISIIRHEAGFWLFILSEFIIFGSLLFCCLYFDYSHYLNLSSSLELPFLGCFFLLGSSIIVTNYHHLLKWQYSFILLIFTIILGLMFVTLQIVEMNEIIMNLYDTVFHASSLCVVGLHFSHVVLGILGLIFCLIMGLEGMGYYRCTIVVWYWHFVDYIWLLVYTFVYVC